MAQEQQCNNAVDKILQETQIVLVGTFAGMADITYSGSFPNEDGVAIRFHYKEAWGYNSSLKELLDHSRNNTILIYPTDMLIKAEKNSNLDSQNNELFLIFVAKDQKVRFSKNTIIYELYKCSDLVRLKYNSREKDEMIGKIKSYYKDKSDVTATK